MLKRSQIADFKSFASVLAGDDIRLSISDGVIRLFAIHLASGEAFTLGFLVMRLFLCLQQCMRV